MKKYRQEFNKTQFCPTIFDCSAAYKPSDCKCQKGNCVNRNLKNNGGCDEDGDECKNTH